MNTDHMNTGAVDAEDGGSAGGMFEDVDIAIVGGGLAGSLLAAAMRRQGKTVRVDELRDDPRQAKIDSDKTGSKRLRSINLALSTRGLTAMENFAPEAVKKVMKNCVPMRGRAVHVLKNNSCSVSIQPYGRTGQALYSVSRATLNELLLDEAERSGAHIEFGNRCTAVDTLAGIINYEKGFKFETSTKMQIKAKIIVGADGASSKVRAAMQSKKGFNYSQQYISHGYKELSIPSGPNGQFLMEKEALHIWPRDDFMLIALPNINGSFTLTLFMAFEGGTKSFEAIQTDEDVLNLFQKEFPDVLPLMPNLLHEFKSNPVSSLVTVRCDPWVCDDKAVILGDAAHAIVPFYGQGCNCAFEDVRIFSELLESNGPNFAKALKEFSTVRKVNADTIADLALSNYVEMREKTNSTLFVLRRTLEQYLEVILPSSWNVADLHSLVSFTNIPYSDVVAKVERQDRAINVCLVSLLSIGAAALMSITSSTMRFGFQRARIL